MVEFKGNITSLARDMNPLYICADPDWLESTFATSGKIYTRDMYIPLPVSLFAKADTRVFDVTATVAVSTAGNPPVEVSNSKRMHFSHFLKTETGDALACSLVNFESSR